MSDAILPIGVGLFALGVLFIIVFSVALLSRENVQAAAINRQQNQPVSNGFALPATIAIVLIFILVLLIGFLPPILRRG